MNPRGDCLCLRWLARTAIAFAAGCGGGGGTSPNLPPIAYGGDTQEVAVGALVTLDGTGSTDPDGDSITFSWAFTRLPPGSVATLSNANTAHPSFVADLPGTYTATLTVSDGTLTSSSTGSANAAVPNTPPIADAGPDQTAFVGNVVTLDGRFSSDANGDPRGYLWQLTTRPVGSNANLSDTASPQPTFVPDAAGSYVVTLTVNDGKDTSAPDSVTITATPNPWGSDAAMPTPRNDVAAIAVGSRIYVLGGTIGGAPTGIVEVFDAETHAWSTAPAMPNPRANFAIAAVGSRIYTIGGGPTGTNGPIADVEEFDTSTGVWTTKAPMPTKRALAGAASVFGTIYVVGGAISPLCIDWVCKATAVVEAYDVASNTWATLTSLPRSMIGQSAVSIGSAVYAIGGEQQGGNVIGMDSRLMHRYDSDTATWTTVASMPIASRSPAAVVVGGKVFVNLAATLRYDPAADAWTSMQAPPSGLVGRLSAAAVGGKVYVFGATATATYEPALDRP